MGTVNFLFTHELHNGQIKATSIFIIVILHHLLTEENVNFYGELGIWWFMPLVLVLRRQTHVDVCQFCASQGCAVGFSQKTKQIRHQSILWWEQFKYPSLCVLRNVTHCCSFHSFYCILGLLFILLDLRFWKLWKHMLQIYRKDQEVIEHPPSKHPTL